MQPYSSATMCDLIDVTLFKYNHIDNLIWTKCLNQVDFIEINQDTIVITPEQLIQVLELNFERELDRIRSMPFDLVHKDATSLYFLMRILSDFDRLKFIKLTLNRTRHFSRTVEDNQKNKEIRYSFRVLKMTIRMNEFFNLKELRNINPHLIKVGLLNADKPYNEVKMQHFINVLENMLNMDDSLSDADAESLGFMVDFMDPKMIGDDPDVMLVTDW